MKYRLSKNNQLYIFPVTKSDLIVYDAIIDRWRQFHTDAPSTKHALRMESYVRGHRWDDIRVVEAIKTPSKWSQMSVHCCDLIGDPNRSGISTETIDTEKRLCPRTTLDRECLLYLISGSPHDWACSEYPNLVPLHLARWSQSRCAWQFDASYKSPHTAQQADSAISMLRSSVEISITIDEMPAGQFRAITAESMQADKSMGAADELHETDPKVILKAIPKVRVTPYATSINPQYPSTDQPIPEMLAWC